MSNRIRFIAKDQNTRDGGSPAVLEAPAPVKYTNDPAESGYWMVGIIPTPSEHDEVNGPLAAKGVTINNNEALVWVPGNLIDKVIADRDR